MNIRESVREASSGRSNQTIHMTSVRLCLEPFDNNTHHNTPNSLSMHHSTRPTRQGADKRLELLRPERVSRCLDRRTGRRTASSLKTRSVRAPTTTSIHRHPLDRPPAISAIVLKADMAPRVLRLGRRSGQASEAWKPSIKRKGRTVSWSK